MLNNAVQYIEDTILRERRRPDGSDMLTDDGSIVVDCRNEDVEIQYAVCDDITHSEQTKYKETAATIDDGNHFEETNISSSGYATVLLPDGRIGVIERDTLFSDISTEDSLQSQLIRTSMENATIYNTEE